MTMIYRHVKSGRLYQVSFDLVSVALCEERSYEDADALAVWRMPSNSTSNASSVFNNFVLPQGVIPQNAAHSYDATLQTDKPLQGHELLVAYTGEDGRRWLRPIAEFIDGRFMHVAGHTLKRPQP